MNFRKTIRTIHLWLGLTSGLLVFIIAVTGSLYSFRTEIENFTQPYRFVKEENKELLLPSRLIATAQKQLPGKAVHAVMYQGKTNAAKVIFYNEAENYYYFVYTNQYSGETLNVSDENGGFFSFILDGHFYLWLPEEIGKLVVASATLVFVIMLITGIVLWFPRNRRAIRQRFRIKLNGRWRRKNFDLHSVIGFYVSFVAIVLATTGLVWGFEWFNDLYYKTISGGKEFVQYENPVSVNSVMDASAVPAIDKIFLKIYSESPADAAIEVHTPEDSISAIAANINPDPSTYWKTDYRYFDQYTLKELSVNHLWGRFNNTTASDKLMRMNYDIHIGAILGIPGKILVFFAGLFVASLPVTGFLLWWGRRNKKMQNGG